MQRTKKLLGLVLTFTLVVVSAYNASAAKVSASPVLDRIQKRGSLIAGTAGSMPPFNMTTRDGQLIGLDVDLAKAIAATMGVKLELKTMPFAKLLPALEAGDLDMVLSSLSITPIRNLKFAFVGPYFISGKSVLTRKQTLAAAKAASDINAVNPILIALKDSTSEGFVKALIPKAKLLTAKTYEEAMNMLLLGEADAVVADYPFCAVQLFRYPDKGLATLAKPLTYEPIGIAVPPGDPLLVNWLENLLAVLDGSGKLEALRERWFKKGDWLKRLAP
jgi:polar amino acid transport system substrate-binding protein